MAKRVRARSKANKHVVHVRPGEDRNIADKRDALRRLRLARMLERQLATESRRLSRTIQRTSETLNTVTNILADRGVYAEHGPYERLELLEATHQELNKRLAVLEGQARESES